MVWSRAAKKEYDAWESFGNPGWNCQNILKYSKKSEGATPASSSTPADFQYNLDTSAHGATGPVKVTYPTYSSDIIPVVFKSMNKQGLPSVSDPSAGFDVGTVSMQSSVNIQTATRSYSASAYYAPYSGKNLIVLTNAQVTKINLSSRPDRQGNYAATSVTYSAGSKTYTVKVRREVVVSGGTYNTPQILELSGIGNKKIVEKAGVKSIIDLPGVGENLQDHMQLVLRPMELRPGFVTRDILGDPNVAAAAMDQYNKNKTGPFSSSLVSVGYLPLSKFTDSKTKASLLKGLDKEIANAEAKNELTPADKVTFPESRRYMDDNGVAALEFLIFPLFLSSDPAVKPKANTSYLTFAICPHHAFARGNTHINTKDGLAKPVIDPKYFSYNFDKEMMIEGVKWVKDLVTKEPVKSAIAVNPYQQDKRWDDDNFIRQFISTFTTSEFHPVGTSAMLPRSNYGVVDSELKVYGTSNIRVADASIMPNHIATHLQATVYSIGEHAADLILSSH
jgi:choline dehydrogenase-like flavoprotein